MAVRSVIDIEVNDGAFQRFSAMFQKYQEQAKAAPSAWKDVGVSIDKAGVSFKDLLAAMGAQTEFAAMLSATQQKAAKDAQEQENRRKSMAGLEDKWARNAKSAATTQATLWRGMAKDSKAFATNISEATRSLLRWTALTGVFTGLLGAGGLFGISRLAQSAGGARRSALGLGVSAGEEKAFGLNYGRVIDPNQFLGGVNEAMHDVTKRVGLYGAGLSQKDVEGKSTAEVADQLLPALKKIADQTPEAMMAQVLQSRHLDQFVSLQDFQRLKNTPAGELDQYRSQYATDVRSLDLSKAQLRAWQDLQVQLHRAGETIEAIFIRGLTPLAPQIKELSDGFTSLVKTLVESPQVKKWITELADGLKQFASFITSPEFKDDIESFTTKVGKFVDDAEAFGGKFLKTMHDTDTVMGRFQHAIENVSKFIDDLVEAMRLLNPFKTKMDRPYTKDEAAAWNAAHPDQAYTGPLADSENDKNWAFDDKTKKWSRTQPTGSGSWLWDKLNPFTPATGDAPRGIRNNNPLNLSYRSDQGAIGSDGRFGVYRTMEDGVAASERQLLKYKEDGFDTISKIINRWAPPGENNTASYIADVSRRTGLKPDDKADVSDPKVAAAMVAAMARRENGRELDPDVVRHGVDMGIYGGPRQTASQGRPLPPGGVRIEINNNTGGNATVATSQLAH